MYTHQHAHEKETRLQDVTSDLNVTDFIYLDDEYLMPYSEVPVPSILPWRRFSGGGLSDKKKYRNVNCCNCGEKGHVVRECDGPITSFGIIAFKEVKSKEDERFDKNSKLAEITNSVGDGELREYPGIKFLMIQRKDTMGYVDFVRGKYPDNNNEIKMKLLKTCLEEMTNEEKNNLLTKPFPALWDLLWRNHASKTYKNEYATAKAKYEQLDIQSLVRSTSTQYEWAEFGFPKGRRNMRENNISCSEREFFEETGYTKLHYDFIKNYPTVTEEFVGTNGVRYRHVYYLVKMRDDVPPPSIDHDNIIQTGEVQNIGWFTFQECMNLIRPYDEAKKHVIQQVYNDIVAMKGMYTCSNFYYNSNTQKRFYFDNGFFRKTNYMKS